MKFVILATMALTIALFSAALTTDVFAAEKPCYFCHASKTKGIVTHQPVADKDCTSCHSKPDGNHQLKKGLYGAKKKGAELCYECHDNMTKGKSVHAPVKDGDCLGCHAPHHSPYKKLLKSDAKELCLECHERQKFFGKSFPHSPVVSGSCGDCHLPHQSNLPKLVKSGKVHLCFECHDPELAKGKSVHSPVADNDCTSCHEPHGGAIAKLLKAAYPTTPDAPFTEEAYALCIGCHEKAAFTVDETSKATGFRDANTNLHALHVKGSNVTCRMCHSVHSASQPKLLRDSAVGKEKAEIILNFTLNKSGGSCKMTCHNPSSYSR